MRHRERRDSVFLIQTILINIFKFFSCTEFQIMFSSLCFIMGKLDYETNTAKYIFIAASARENAEANRAGLKRCGLTLQWTTRDARKALKLRAFANAETELKFKNTFMSTFERPDEIIYPDHLTPKTFQIKSAFHCLTRSPAYCADEAGLGKTITAALCMNTVPGRALVICPPFLKYNWAREIHTWCPDKKIISILDGPSVELAYFNANVVICPDSIVARPEILRRLLEVCPLQWCFIDEAHRFKDPKAQRSEAVLGKLGITNLAERTVFLSGTPVERPIELFPLLDARAPWAINYRSEREYGKEFCAGKMVKVKGEYWGRPTLAWDFRGASNLTRLREELRKDFMIRHLKRNVLKELPPKIRQIIFLDKPKEIEKYEKRVLARHNLEDLLGEDYHLGDVARYRKECGALKVEAAGTFVRDALGESGKPLIVFAHHIDVIENLAKSLSEFDPIVIRGGLTAAQKDERARAFQSSKSRLLIGNLDAMGVGLTLTRAKRVIFAEYSWVFGKNEQAEDRAHRITQDGDVLIQYLIMRNSLDERQLRSVLQKQNDIELMMS